MDFYYAVKDPGAADARGGYLEKMYGAVPESFPAVVRAYYASVEGLKAKHARDLFPKLGHVNRAIALFHGLVETSPDNVEIRFLRYALFSQLPFFFGVRSYISTDLSAIVDQLEARRYDEVPLDIQQAIVVYLLANAPLDRAARARLQEVAAGGQESRPGPLR